MADQFTSEDDFIDWLADECEKSDKAVKKVRNAIRALRAQRNTSLEQQLVHAEERATQMVQDTLAVIKAATSNPVLADINSNDEYLDIKAAFKKTVRTLNVCTQDIQQQNLVSTFDEAPAQYEDETSQYNNVDTATGADDLQIEMVYDTEQVDIDEQIAKENREDAMQLAQDTVVLRDMMQDTVEIIEEQGEQLKEIDDSVEASAETTEDAVKELTSAREHQKSVQKLKIIIGSIIGCCVLVAIIMLALTFGTNTFGNNPSAPAASTTSDTDSANSDTGSDSGSSSRATDAPKVLLRRALQATNFQELLFE